MLAKIKELLRWYKINFPLELKKNIAYPETFWFAVTTIPLWSLLQVLFIETIYGQLDSFLGYSKWENYVLFGTYKIVQSLAVIIFMVQLDELPDKVRGNEGDSFDTVLMKPMDSQIMATTGRIWFGSISPLAVGAAMVFYGLTNEPHAINVMNVVTYLITVGLAVVLFYLLYLFIQTWLFWFEYLQVGETLWFEVQNIGQYPRGLYKGGLGVLMNIAVPVTLAASVPADFLFGTLPWWRLAIYFMIIYVLTLLTRKFWQYSIRKYSSFSS